MSFLCPVRVKKTRRKSDFEKSFPLGRITGSDSLDTLVQVQAAKDAGTKVRMVIIHDFEPCVDDELKVSRGEEVAVLYQENDWLYIITEDQREGFVPYNYCLPLERSVDDFANVLQKTELVKKSVPKSGKSDSGESSSFSLATPLKSRHRRTSKSMPDIAQTCEAKSLQNSVVSDPDSSKTDDRLSQGKVINRESSTSNTKVHVDNNSSSNTEICVDNDWDTSEWIRAGARRGRQSRRSIASAQTPVSNHVDIKPRSQSLDRTDWMVPPHFRSHRSSHISNYSRSYRDGRSYTSNNTSQSSTKSTYSDGGSEEHIYANDSLRKQQYIQNKPDVLPNTGESYPYHSSRTSLASKQGSTSWKNSSARSDTSYHCPHPSNSVTLSSSRSHSAHSEQSSSTHRNQNWFSSSDGGSSNLSTQDILINNKESNACSDQSQGTVSLFTKVSHGKYIALFGFKAREENDVSLVRGEFVTVLNTDDGAWSWVMKENHEEGFVPSSYVCPSDNNSRRSNMRRGVTSRNSTRSDGYLTKHSKSRTHSHATKQDEWERRSHGSYRQTPPTRQIHSSHSLDNQSVSLGVPNSLPEPSLGQRDTDISKMTQLVCLYNFTARSAEDLSVTRGDWLYANFDRQKEASWLWVYSPLYRRAGFVPRSYVKPPNFGYQDSGHGEESANVRNVRARQGAEARQDIEVLPASGSVDPFMSP